MNKKKFYMVLVPIVIYFTIHCISFLVKASEVTAQTKSSFASFKFLAGGNNGYNYPQYAYLLKYDGVEYIITGAGHIIQHKEKQ